MPKLIATLKEPIQALVEFEEFWETDALGTSGIIEQHKKNLVRRIRDEMHSKIAVLDMDDVKFSIVDN